MHGHVEVAHHTLDDGQLLPVLLAKIRHMGGREQKELEHHGAYALKMRGAAHAAQPPRHIRHVDPGAVIRRIHGFGRRVEKRVHAQALGGGGVALQVARVGGQVFARAELRGVHKKAHHHAVGMLPRMAHEGFMPGMVIAHSGNKGDAVALIPPLPAKGTNIVGCCEYLHIKV